MHLPHVVTTPTALLATLCLLTLARASGQNWGEEVGGVAGTRGDNWASARLTAAGHLEGVAKGTSELCDHARLQCTVRTGCQMALNNFFHGCNSIILGEEKRCTTACQHALVSLLATEDGAGLAFINCDCSGHAVCEERKQRVTVCQRHVLDSMDLVRDHRAALSCSFARWICEADTSCLAALQYYVQHCSKLFTGTRCTAKCRNSVHILYRQPNAHKLRTCRCEGDEDYDCPSLVANTERLCFHRHRHHHNGSSHHHLEQQNDDDDYHSDGEAFRRPGRRPATSNTQRHSSGQTSVLNTQVSGPRTAQPRPFRRRKRRNKPRRNKPKNLALRSSSSTIFVDQKGHSTLTGQKGRRMLTHQKGHPALTDQKGRRALKRRAGGGQGKARRTRRRLCGVGMRAQGRKRRGTAKKGRARGRKRCALKKSAKQKTASSKKSKELLSPKRRAVSRVKAKPQSS